MAVISWKAGLGIALVAYVYNAFLHELLFSTVGIGRHVQDISEFPYQCRRIEDPRLSACEDMFLSTATRQLFLACSNSLTRPQWMPNVGHFNASGRSLDDAVIAMDIDVPAKINGQDSFQYRVLKTPGYPPNAHDDSTLHLVGFTGIDSPNTVELLFVNAKPSRDPITGEILDQAIVGGNSTIERFVTGPAATQMKHVATYAHPKIATPNNIAVGPGMKGFFITNDHGTAKTGIQHAVSPYARTGDVTYCDTSNPNNLQCHRVAKGLGFPNGLVYAPTHDLLYVPSAAFGNIHVYKPKYHGNSTAPDLDYVHKIKIPYPMDNLSLDPYTGEVYAPGFPRVLEMMAGFEDPLHATAPSTHHRVRLVSAPGQKLEYEVEKILEHTGENSPLPAATSLIKDGKTGRLFLSAPSVAT